METPVLRVKSRKLEQFFYLHGIDFISYGKDPEDGMTVWVYPDNEETQNIYEEFRRVLRRRQTTKGA